jgi:chemotaxis receptor (MCP) glutamine deamidase CheD
VVLPILGGHKRTAHLKFKVFGGSSMLMPPMGWQVGSDKKGTSGVEVHSSEFR